MKKRVLYTGLEPAGNFFEKEVLHLPFISMEARSLDIKEIKDVFDRIYSYTHILFTSKYAVASFFRCMEELKVPVDHLDPVFLLAIGSSTRIELEKHKVTINYVGTDETDEGAIRLLETLDIEDGNILLPQSGMTRPKLVHYLVEKGISYEVIILYDLLKQRPAMRVNLNDFDEIIFTSPVAVDAFFEVYDDLPPAMEVHSMGLATRCHLKECLSGKELAAK